MARCGKCGAKHGHFPGCENAPAPKRDRRLPDPGGPGGPGTVKRHKHSFTVHIRRGGGKVGPVYDVWGCSVAGCSKTETRNA